MKTILFKYPWPKPSKVLRGAAMAAGLLLSLQARATTVTTLGGGPSQYNANYYGYANGNTEDVAQFHTPIGLALDSTFDYLYVADRDNNAIRLLDLAGGNTYTFTTNFINQPVGVAVDSSDDVFVLNRGNGTNGTVLEFDYFGDLLATEATSLTNAAGIALDPAGNIYVTASNQLLKITSPGVVTTVATITNTNASLSGVVVMTSGQIAVADAGRDGIYMINPTSGLVTTNTGFNGAGDRFGPKNISQFFQPYGLAEAGNGSLVVADYGNNRVKVVNSIGTVTNLYGVDSNYWVTGPGTYPGWWDGTVVYGPAANNYNIEGSVEARSPAGVVVGSDGTAYITEDYYHIIREVTGGLTPPPPPPPPPPLPSAPVIGYVTFPAPNYTSVLTPVSSFVFNNDVKIAIEGTNGALTFFTSGPTGSVPTPSTNSSTAPAYQDGLTTFGFTDLPGGRYGDMTIKAITVNGDGEASPVTSARFQFVTATPTISGDNGAQFTVSDLTSNALMYYTIDGTEPTTNSIGPVYSGDTLSLNVTNNLTFNIRAFNDYFQPSGILSKTFSPSNFAANTMSFGFASGPGSCKFVASPGQYFTVPVGITLLSGAPPIYGLQFNVTLTNLTSHTVDPQTIDFGSLLGKPDTNNDGYYDIIPTYMFVSTNQPINDTNVVQIGTNGAWYQNLMFADTNNEDLLGAGWLEVYGRTNLYDTKSQNLLTYPVLRGNEPYPNSSKIVGYYTFQIPPDAVPGDVYQIQIGRPSATTFPNGTVGYGLPVTVVAPADTNLVGPGSVNALKDVTIGSIPYLVGDVYPANWFNAGDFGSSYLANIDVMRVFDFAAYPIAAPPAKSDLFDALDSCGGIGVNNGSGIYTNAGPLTVAEEYALFNGNDSTINQIAFGNGKLDVCDVYVTFRRSLDSSLAWFDRFWTNGVREAVAVPNVVPQPSATQSQVSSMNTVQSQTQTLSSTNSPVVNFAATDVLGSAGQTVQIPITAQIIGAYPLRVLMLNLSVVPLDGSPPLTTPISFSPNPILGTPSIPTDSTGNNNYAAAWLNSTISGLTGNATIGTLTVTIPTNAVSLSAYAVHFDEVSGSPNGLISFPKNTLTGLIALSSRTNSCYGDGIPDSWRLRWFGTTNDLLSVSNACPSGDGVNNWMKYVAGVDPNVAGDFPSLNAKAPLPAGTTAAIYWPTVSGKHYVILRSSTLFPGSWTAISTNTGTGTDMEFDDTTAGQAHFYRVRILP